MRKLFNTKIPFIWGCSFIFTFSLWTQQVIENPDKPLAKNAGRVLKLREVWRITDDSRQFYFKSPHNLQIAGGIVKSFRRTYPRVKHVAGKQEEEFRKTYGLTEISHEWDVFDLFVNEGRVWVKTSTNDAVKGDLYDVFDENGRFIDNFYLGSGRLLLKAQGDALFSLEKDTGDNHYIVKYKIES